MQPTMQGLHGTWVTVPDPSLLRFAFWAEADASRVPRSKTRKAARTGDRKGPPAHPAAAPAGALADALRVLGNADPPTATHAGTVVALLPSRGGRPLASPAATSSGDDGASAAGQPPALAEWSLPVLECEAPAAAQALLSLAAAPVEPSGALGEDLRFWIAATRFALELLPRQRVLPALERDGDTYVARWRLSLDEEPDGQRFAALAGAMPPVCRALAWESGAAPPHPRQLLRSYLDAVADGVARQALAGPSGGRSPSRTAPRRRASTAGGDVSDAWQAWWAALSGPPQLAAPPATLQALEQQYRTWKEGSAATGAADTFRVCFRLDPPLGEGEQEAAPAKREEPARPAGPARDARAAVAIRSATRR
jgi:hypothetical protein